MNRRMMWMIVLGFASVLSISAATTIDLTTPGALEDVTAAIGGTFVVQQVPDQSTGTGVIDSFLRIQMNGNEQGYNTSLGTPYDDKGGIFTRALTLAEIPIVTFGGVLYRQILLDINETTPDTLLSLNQIQIFQNAGDRIDGTATPTPPQTGIASILSFPSGATEVFRMNSPALESEILLNFMLNPGSGAGDMFLYVPAGLFNPAYGSNVILYSQFGTPPGTQPSSDGFEEWSVVKGGSTVVVPEPASIALFGTLILGTGILLRRRRSA